MNNKRIQVIVLIFVFLIPLLVASDIQKRDITPLKTEVQKIISEYHGEVGVAIEHIETGQGFSINGHKRFPLASVYKVPIMVEVFRQVAEGKFSIKDRIEMQPEMYHPWGPVMSYFEPGLRPTVRDLVYWMMVESDNLATDILLEKVVAKKVRETLRKLGLEEVSVDRSTKVIIFDYYGYSGEKYYKLLGEELEKMARLFAKIHNERAEVARRHGPLPEAVVKYNKDPRDTGSPLHINELFMKIFKGEVVSKEACEEMIKIMLDCRTGDTRIKGMLPPRTPVAHKTGGWPTSNNNAGIIYLPDGKGHVAVTVLDTNMNEDFAVSSKMIARVARAAYDFFVKK